ILPTPIHKLTLTGLSMGERTGSRVFQWVWSYVLDVPLAYAYKSISSVPSMASLI
ncbi:hypothetical protein B0T09DRAFT_238833, partial [Sordaria sp. MPI-SDFR-AT-0083]